MERELNNKGLTLVELIIAVAMSTVIIGAASMFLYNAEKTYHTAEYSVDLQLEAQILMEQVANWVMESNRIVVSDDRKVLVLYYIPRNNNKNLGDLYPLGFSPSEVVTASRRIIFCEDGKLYMKSENGIADAQSQVNGIINPVAGSPEFYTDADLIPENCIGEYVGSFSLSITDPKESIMSVTVNLGMQESTQGYSVSDTFSLRNGLYEHGASASPSPTPGVTPEPAVTPAPTTEP